MCRRSWVSIISAVVAFVLLEPADGAFGQACGSCIPVRQQVVSGTISYRLEPSVIGDYRTKFDQAAQEWTNAFAAANTNITLVGSSNGVIPVSLLCQRSARFRL